MKFYLIKNPNDAGGHMYDLCTPRTDGKYVVWATVQDEFVDTARLHSYPHPEVIEVTDDS